MALSVPYIIVIVAGGMIILTILPFLLTAIYLYFKNMWLLIKRPQTYREWNRVRKEWNKIAAKDSCNREADSIYRGSPSGGRRRKTRTITRGPFLLCCTSMNFTYQTTLFTNFHFIDAENVFPGKVTPPALVNLECQWYMVQSTV